MGSTVSASVHRCFIDQKDSSYSLPTKKYYSLSSLKLSGSSRPLESNSQSSTQTPTNKNQELQFLRSLTYEQLDSCIDSFISRNSFNASITMKKAPSNCNFTTDPEKEQIRNTENISQDKFQQTFDLNSQNKRSLKVDAQTNCQSSELNRDNCNQNRKDQAKQQASSQTGKAIKRRTVKKQILATILEEDSQSLIRIQSDDYFIDLKLTKERGGPLVVPIQSYQKYT